MTSNCSLLLSVYAHFNKIVFNYLNTKKQKYLIDFVKQTMSYSTIFQAVKLEIPVMFTFGTMYSHRVHVILLFTFVGQRKIEKKKTAVVSMLFRIFRFGCILGQISIAKVMQRKVTSSSRAKWIGINDTRRTKMVLACTMLTVKQPIISYPRREWYVNRIYHKSEIIIEIILLRE